MPVEEFPPSHWHPVLAAPPRAAAAFPGSALQRNTNQLNRTKLGNRNTNNPKLEPTQGLPGDRVAAMDQDSNLYPPEPALKTDANNSKESWNRAGSPAGLGLSCGCGRAAPTSAGTLQWRGKGQALPSAPNPLLLHPVLPIRNPQLRADSVSALPASLGPSLPHPTLPRSATAPPS